MATRWVVNGECMVLVKGNEDSLISSISELGLAKEQIRIHPRWYHHPLLVDDFGPEVPASMLYMIAEVIIMMTLIYYDELVLDEVVKQTLCGQPESGKLVESGTPMDGGERLYKKNNHFVTMGLTSPVLGKPWTFPRCYLLSSPYEYPVGTNVTEVQLVWRALPHKRPPNIADVPGQVRSKDAKLWVRELLNDDLANSLA